MTDDIEAHVPHPDAPVYQACFDMKRDGWGGLNLRCLNAGMNTLLMSRAIGGAWRQDQPFFFMSLVKSGSWEGEVLVKSGCCELPVKNGRWELLLKSDSWELLVKSRGRELFVKGWEPI